MAVDRRPVSGRRFLVFVSTISKAPADYSLPSTGQGWTLPLNGGNGMRHDWLVAQLDAMKNYAQKNDLPKLAESLQLAKLVALTEIASVDSSAATQPQQDT